MIFDGSNHRIILEASDGDTVEAIDGIYSRWKDWVVGDDGSKYVEAFVESFGSNAIGGGKKAGAYVFLNTAGGWRIRPREAAHELTIVGNVYPDVEGVSMFAPTLGVFQIQINLERSSLTQIAGGSIVTQVQAGMTAQGYTSARATLLDELDASDPDSIAAAVQLIRRITDNRLEVDIDAQALKLYDDAGLAVIRSWPLATKDGELVRTAVGVQTKRGAPT
jgi:hypothetical protein